MMMCVDELESQRRELEARRAMLEERFKLRLATAQEFGMIHTQRLGRVREAFVAQCGAARRRNQSILDKAKQSNDAFSHERALSGLSHKRLSHQTERFLSVADKLYPAWQEEQLHRKTRQLATIEEERFVTEQRRREARDRFEQEQALAAVIAEGQRRLAAARAHERNESAIRQVRRGRSTAADGQALNAELERVNEAGRNARYDALAGGSNSARYGSLAEEEATRRRRRRGENDPRSSDESSDGGSDDSGDRGEGAGRRGKRCYIGTDDDLDEGDERESCGVSEGGSGSIGKARGGAERAVPASEGVGQAWRDGEVPAGVTKEQRSENEGGGANSHERSRVAEGSTRRGRGRGDVESLEQDVLQDVFCARQGEASHKAGRVGDRATGNPESRCGDDTAAAGLGDNRAVGGESLQRRSSSSPLTVRKNGRHGSGMPATATTKPDAERARERRSKTRDSRRRHRRRRSDENELSVEPPQNLPPPPPKRSDGGCDSGVNEDVDSVHGVASAGGKPSYSTKETAELDLPRPPEKLSSTPGQRGDRARSFSSSGGSGRVMTVSSEEPASKLRDGGGTAGSSRKGVRERLSREATAAGNGATGVVIAAARVPSWSEEEEGEEEEDTNEDNDAGNEAENKKRGSTTASAILSSEAAGFGHAVTAVLGRKDSPRDGRHGEPKVRRTPSKEGYLPTTLATPSRRPCLSLPEAARAVAALTAQIENLPAVLAAAPYGDEPGPSSSLSPSRQVLDAYGSVATVRSDGAKAAAAAAAAAAVATPVDDTAASTFPPSELAAFEMADLCAAVLDLITVHSTEILPAEALSGIVTAEKVRAEHRRGGKAHPGRLQLFDAVTSHARRLASGKDLGGVDHSTTAIAGVFAPCFEAAFSSSTARGNRAAGGGGASERLRRKVFAFLESAAGSNGAVDRGATAVRKNHSSSKPTPAMPVMAATGLTKNHRGSSGLTKRAEGLPDARQPKGESGGGSGTAAATAKSPPIDSTQQPQQQGQWGLTAPSVGASSGGMVLGGGRSLGNTGKNGGRLDLSSITGSMGGLSTAGNVGGLPEFEDYDSLEELEE